MAKCDEGYFCSVCDRDVKDITESDLYLRYVIGLLDPELLHVTPEKHIRCNPALAQFIVTDKFPPVTLEDEFAKSNLDPAYVQARESLVTRGWERLQELKSTGEISVLDMPLPEIINAMNR